MVLLEEESVCCGRFREEQTVWLLSEAKVRVWTVYFALTHKKVQKTAREQKPPDLKKPGKTGFHGAQPLDSGQGNSAQAGLTEKQCKRPLPQKTS